MKILLIATAFTFLGKIVFAQTFSTYADTANYLMHEIGEKRSQYIGNSFSVLIDSLKLKPVDFSIGSNGFNNNKGKYFYLKLEDKQRIESPFIIVGFDSIPDYDKILPLFRSDSGIARLQRVLNAFRPLAVAQLSISIYQKETTNLSTLGKIGAIEVTKVKRDFIRNSKDDLTRRKANKARNPVQKSYYDEEGKVLKTIVFENNIEEASNKVDYAFVYLYSNNKLVKEFLYRKGKGNNLYLDKATKITYDRQGNRFTDSVFYYRKDLIDFFLSNPGLVQQKYSTYQYFNNPKQIQHVFDRDFYYLTTFFGSTDSLKSVQQFANGRVRWEWNYIYKGNRRTGSFQSFYSNFENVAQKELVLLNNKNQIIEIEDQWIGQSYRNRKRKIFYAMNGTINRINYYEINQTTGLYEVVSFTRVKARAKVKITENIAKTINSII